ncbi:MAG: 2,3,4,5-tetrahydropyridine-2,6-dicarboxylate N-succinyltransferase [Bradymonadales bacterium]|nr:2,3,4,5-tetrahydropyridine-2,6-dicarboxylate N-succinyltransferase [Bradymonadales bacterium]
MSSSRMEVGEIREAIAEQFHQPSSMLGEETLRLVTEFLAALNRGELRAAHRDEQGGWTADVVVKQGILLAFRAGTLTRKEQPPFFWSDKSTLPLRTIDPFQHNLRLVPGGSSIREGCYLGQNVVCMPPMYINIGAWVDDDTMIDSHVLIGSCAQIGKRVHLSAGAQIGGVLEPVGAVPVVIEDNVLVGGNAGIFEGTIVRQGAVVGAGTILTRTMPVYDLVKERVIEAGPGEALDIPERAVVVPGSRPARGSFAHQAGLQVYTPLIIKYRDEGTEARTALSEDLR